MTLWLIMGTAERTEVTQNFENRQFEFLRRKKYREPGFGKQEGFLDTIFGLRSKNHWK
ncbi:hypothetical protein [Flagellimonas marinaquae]|uniref:hypothetical protein n=1 Tax=Flagellimonas marinaquae TaxID=254955 RepID=UPI0013DF6BF1|nr:hypothetical protein [Allomuricauda aquimarina]